MASLPQMYWPVTEAGLQATSSGVPARDDLAAVRARAPGRGRRRSRRGGWSPRRARRRGRCCRGRAGAESVSSSFWLSRGCRPMRRLVENVEHAAQLRADLRGEPDALAFAARERGRGAVEREVAEADRVEEAQAVAYLAQDEAGDLRLALVELELVEGGDRVFDRERGVLARCLGCRRGRRATRAASAGPRQSGHSTGETSSSRASRTRSFGALCMRSRRCRTAPFQSLSYL